MAQSKEEFEKGDYVSWKYGVGTATGYVVEKLTEPAKLGNKKFQASPEEPKYKVRSDKSGKMAIRNPETLERIRNGERHEGEDQNGAEEEDEDEEMHPADNGEKAKEAEAAKMEDDENGAPHEDGEENGSRKRQKSEPAAEKTVDNVGATEEPLGDGEAKLDEHANGKHDEKQNKSVGEDDKAGEKEHKLPHEEVPQPGEFTDLEAAKALEVP